MHEPRTIQGARTRLFDRLVDYEPWSAEERPRRVLDRAELRESVRREVERLLGTRCTLPMDVPEERPRTVLEYGLPDFTPLYTRNPDDQAELAARIQRCITAYEPRLRDVRVSVEPPGSSQRELLARVEGVLGAGDVVEPVSFTVPAENLR